MVFGIGRCGEGEQKAPKIIERNLWTAPYEQLNYNKYRVISHRVHGGLGSNSYEIRGSYIFITPLNTPSRAERSALRRQK